MGTLIISNGFHGVLYLLDGVGDHFLGLMESLCGKSLCFIKI